MHIAHLEIANFRKLLSVRIDLAEQKTLFVGANNSGKTSAMLALRRFFKERGRHFHISDITLSHWTKINEIGEAWSTSGGNEGAPPPDAQPLIELLPTLDVWLNVGGNEFHHVSDLIPLLDWSGGLLGVRMRLEPEDVTVLYRDYVAAASEARSLRASARGGAAGADGDGQTTKLTLWPESLIDFMSRRLMNYFVLRSYTLDPTKLERPLANQARPQTLPLEAPPTKDFPFSKLVRVHEINAQRGFGESDGADVDSSTAVGASSRLSQQLRDYYTRHLDPTEKPDPADLEALVAIETAETAFNEKLRDSFNPAFREVQELGYPGVTDPKLKVAARLKTVDGLDHEAAVSFEIDVVDEAGEQMPVLRLPEANNGLGYQNLISMVFRLMAFRDSWLRVGKAGKTSMLEAPEPLHLVLIEEPEAHLHAQVQQVFIRKAYSVLMNRPELSGNSALHTQLVVSTHSSHVAHETPYACLRYFRRLPAGMASGVPVTTVVNLSETFGAGNATERFVTRYLHAQHADLFFADAAVLVEGPAERILIPNFIREKYEFLNQCYLTILEIGGSHAHRLKPLICQLGLLTLVITDLDSLGTDGKAAPPTRKTGQKSNNSTLKDWVPAFEAIDQLLDASPEQKEWKQQAASGSTVGAEQKSDILFAVRAAYQTPLEAEKPGSGIVEEACPYTFEDALAFENLDFFANLDGAGLVRKFRDAINDNPNVAAIGEAMFKALRDGKKAEFALEIIGSETFSSLQPPTYIAEGLKWLEGRLHKKQAEILPKTKSEGSDDDERS